MLPESLFIARPAPCVVCSSSFWRFSLLSAPPYCCETQPPPRTISTTDRSALTSASRGPRLRLPERRVRHFHTAPNGFFRSYASTAVWTWLVRHTATAGSFASTWVSFG